MTITTTIATPIAISSLGFGRPRSGAGPAGGEEVDAAADAGVGGGSEAGGGPPAG